MQEIVNKLATDGLPLSDCRGQVYNNGANMAGIYNGAQAFITQQSNDARFVPCAAHSLNLVGVHASSVSAVMVTFLELSSQCIITFHHQPVVGRN